MTPADCVSELIEAAEESGLVPLLKPNRSLTQDFLYERAVDIVTRVGIRNPHLQGAFPHELMPAPWDRPLEAKTTKTADQLSPGDRFRHASRGSGREADPTDARDRIVVADLQDKPLFEHFLEHLAARVNSRFVRPDSRQSRNVTETGAVLDSLVSSSLHRFADVTSQHRFNHTKAGRTGTEPPIRSTWWKGSTPGGPGQINRSPPCYASNPHYDLVSLKTDWSPRCGRYFAAQAVLSPGVSQNPP